MMEFTCELEALKREIENAFANVRYPGDRPKDVSQAMDPVETERTWKLLGGKRWEDWKDKPLSALQDGIHESQIVCLTPWAYRYYLPLYMLAAASDCDEADVIPDSVMFSLTRPKDPRDVENYDERHGELSPQQLQSILKFLDFMKRHHYHEPHLQPWRDAVERAVVSIRELAERRRGP